GGGGGRWCPRGAGGQRGGPRGPQRGSPGSAPPQEGAGGGCTPVAAGGGGACQARSTALPATEQPAPPTCGCVCARTDCGRPGRRGKCRAKVPTGRARGRC